MKDTESTFVRVYIIAKSLILFHTILRSDILKKCYGLVGTKHAIEESEKLDDFLKVRNRPISYRFFLS